MALPNISCSNCYFPSGSGAALTGGSNVSDIVVKGGGGFFLTNVGQRPFIPIAGMSFDAGTQTNRYLPVASNKAQMGLTAMKWFIASLNASTNYALDNGAGADQILPADSDENYYGYLYKRIGASSNMLQRFNYIANLVFNFWLNSDAAWTTAQYEDAIRKFKTELKGLADPNLYLINALDCSAASVLSIQIAAFKVADANLHGFECLEIQLS
jgi:hypothetical protein